MVCWRTRWDSLWPNYLPIWIIDSNSNNKYPILGTENESTDEVIEFEFDNDSDSQYTYDNYGRIVKEVHIHKTPTGRVVKQTTYIYEEEDYADE